MGAYQFAPRKQYPENDDCNRGKQGGVMKLAVTSKGDQLGSAVDPRFGRAPYIVIVDTDTMDFDVVDNRKNADALRGAGIQAARVLSERGAEVLLTGHCGPNAFKALQAARIGVVNNANGSVEEAVAAYREGKLSPAREPDVDGHW
jgi:predicted Fe-Mo cluster-binding NifX family protein